MLALGEASDPYGIVTCECRRCKFFEINGAHTHAMETSHVQRCNSSQWSFETWPQACRHSIARFLAAQKAYVSRVQPAIADAFFVLITSKPGNLVPEMGAYAADWMQRWILFWDTLRERGNNFLEHEPRANRRCWCSNTKRLSMAVTVSGQ